jgi:nucleotide-binding universal stress UspA family protein
MNAMQSWGRIVVGIDGSAVSVAALVAAARIARATGARVDAVTCWSVPAALALPYALGTVDFEGGARKVLENAVVAAFGGDTPDHVTARLVQGLPRQVLLEASDGADMLVLGRRGHGGFPGLVMGSVSQACIAHARCPVLVMNPEDFPEGAARNGLPDPL